MSKLPLKPLVWQPDLIYSNRISSVTDLYYYGIDYDPWAKKYEVEYQSDHGLPATGFATIEDAKEWCWESLQRENAAVCFDN